MQNLGWGGEGGRVLGKKRVKHLEPVPLIAKAHPQSRLTRNHDQGKQAADMNRVPEIDFYSLNTGVFGLMLCQMIQFWPQRGYSFLCYSCMMHLCMHDAEHFELYCIHD